MEHSEPNLDQAVDQEFLFKVISIFSLSLGSRRRHRRPGCGGFAVTNMFVSHL